MSYRILVSMVMVLAASFAPGLASAADPPATVASAEVQASGTIKAWVAMTVSDQKQIVGNGIGVNEVEAKLSARDDCGNGGASDCQDLLVLPFAAGSCMALAISPDLIKTNKRAVFAAKGADLQAIQDEALAACGQSGAKKCQINLAKCF